MKLIIPISFFRGKPRSEIWILDTESQHKTKVYREETPTDYAVEGKGITGIAWINARKLVACNFNHLLFINPQNWQRQAILFREDFNDLHQLAIKDNKIFIVNTGLDSIDVLSTALAWHTRISLVDGEHIKQRIQGAYQTQGDYYTCPNTVPKFYLRKVPNTHHLNHICFIEKRILSTSFSQQCLIEIESGNPASNILSNKPHDGIVHNGFLWVTTVNGEIHRAALNTKHLEFETVFSLFEYAPHHGWCRGLYIQRDALFVGITAIHQTNSRTQWLTQAEHCTKTGVYRLDLQTGVIHDWYDFSDEDGSRIFSMIPANCVETPS